MGETIENEVTEQKDRFFGLLFGTSGASLLGNMLAGKGVVRGGDGVIRASEEIIIAGEDRIFNAVLSAFLWFEKV